MSTTTAVLLGIFLLLGLLFGLACFALGPAGWLFWALSVAFVAGCGIFYGLWRLLGIWVIGAPLLFLMGGAMLFSAACDRRTLGMVFVAAVVAIGLKILCPRREP